LLDQEHQHRLASNGVGYSDHPIERLIYVEHQLRSVQLRGGRVVPADALFFQSGRNQASTIATSLGCKLADNTYPTNRKLQTDVPGVYVAGDAAGEIQFVIAAAAEGATAAVAINQELQEDLD
jgi:thioredoxin reductase